MIYSSDGSVYEDAASHQVGAPITPEEGTKHIQSAPMEKQAGLLDMIFGSSASSSVGKTYPSSINAPFPNDEDVAFASQNQNSYGTSAEPFVENKSARVLGGMTKRGFAPMSILDLPKDQRIDLAVDERMHNMVPVRETKSLDPGTVGEIYNAFGKSALAVARDPIASLGFDPKNTLMDVQSAHVNIGGLTDNEERPGSQRMYVNSSANDYATAIVHESMHNGLTKLEQGLYQGDTETPKKYQDLLKKHGLKNIEQEDVVRYLASTVMGDPEKGSGEVTTKQTARAKQLFQNEKYFAFLKDLQDLAAEAIAKKRPGGPH